MSLHNTDKLVLECPHSPDWAAAEKEANKTKPEQAATVMMEIYAAAGEVAEGVHERLVRTDGNVETAMSWEAVKISMAHALNCFIAYSYEPGDQQISFIVDRSKWFSAELSDWFKAPDACALMLLEYGVLQAAGFSVPAEEIRGQA